MSTRKGFELRPHRDRGFYSVFFDGEPLIQHAFLSVEGEDETFASLDARFSLSEKSEGERTQLLFTDNERLLNLEFHARRIEEGGGLVFNVVLINKSDRDLRIKNIFPLIVRSENGGRFTFLDSTNDIKVLNDEWERCYGGSKAKSLASRPNVLSAWDLHLFNAEKGLNLSASFFEAPNAKISFRLQHLDTSNNVHFIVRADTHTGTRGVLLKPGTVFRLSETVLLLSESSPHACLENYARLVARRNRVNPPTKSPVGWADWYFAYGTTTEEEALRNLNFIAQELKDFGVEYFEIDSAWQLGVESEPPPDNVIAGGPWMPNSKFPHGMKWFAERVREKGLRPGIWVRPFQMTEAAPERKEHPQWFNAKGQMDFSNPEVWAWVEKLFKTLTDEWGYEYIKYDFPAFDLYGQWGPKLFDDHASHAEPHDQTLTSIQAYREALRVIREATEGKAMVMACNSLIAPTIGLASAYRIGDDVGDWARTFTYGVKSVSARYYANGVYWANDPDCLIVREPFTLEEARTWASLVALSGGVVFISEKVYALPPERLDIIKKVLPVYQAYGKEYQFGRPVDLLEKETPEIWNLHMKKDFGEWNIVGVFHWSDQRVMKRLDFVSLDLKRNTSYLLYDFWEDEFLGEHVGFVDLELHPHSCRVLAIHRKLQRPQLLSSTRHITQGGVEVTSLRWDDSTLTLSGVCHVIKSNPFVLSLYVPTGFLLVGKRGVGEEKSKRKDVFRLRVSSDDTRDIPWEIDFQKG